MPRPARFETSPGVGQTLTRDPDGLRAVLLLLDAPQQLFLKAVALREQVAQPIFDVTSHLSGLDHGGLMDL